MNHVLWEPGAGDCPRYPGESGNEGDAEGPKPSRLLPSQSRSLVKFRRLDHHTLELPGDQNPEPPLPEGNGRKTPSEYPYLPLLLASFPSALSPPNTPHTLQPYALSPTL